MTIETVDSSISYPGNGVTTNFSFNFKTLDPVDIKVYEGATLTGAVVTVNLNIDQETTPGGSVDLSIAPLTGIVVTVQREVDLTQPRAYPVGGAFPSASHEAALDKLTLISQQQQEEIGRQVSLPIGYPLSNVTLPFPDTLLTLRWNATADELENWDPKTAGVLDPNTFPEVVANKALANALTIIDGKKVFITSPDGGEFTMRTGQPIGTYNDDGGILTGTKFTNGDGSSGIERENNGVINSKWFEGGIIPVGVPSELIVSPSGINFTNNALAANTLGLYAESSFTVTLSAGVGSITLSPSADTLAYTRIGQETFVQGRIGVDSVSTPSGILTLNGLPFLSATLPGLSGILRTEVHYDVLVAGCTVGLVGQITPASTSVVISDKTTIGIAAAASFIGAGTELLFNFSYISD